MASLKKSMDIIGDVSETWLHELIQDSLVNIENFQLLRNDRVGKKVEEPAFTYIIP